MYGMEGCAFPSRPTSGPGQGGPPLALSGELHAPLSAGGRLTNSRGAPQDGRQVHPVAPASVVFLQMGQACPGIFSPHRDSRVIPLLPGSLTARLAV